MYSNMDSHSMLGFDLITVQLSKAYVESYTGTSSNMYHQVFKEHVNIGVIFSFIGNSQCHYSIKSAAS